MHKNFCLPLCGLLAALALTALPAGAASIRAGLASVVLAGDPADPQRREVNALVIEAGTELIALCALDAGALGKVTFDAAVAALSNAGSPVDAERLMLAATHTHSGVYSGLLEGPIQEIAFGVYNPANVAEAAANVRDAVLAAEANLEPVRLRVASGEDAAFTVNRSYPGGAIDPALTVIAIETLTGNLLGYFVNYTAHPTILFRTPFKGSDYPGGMRGRLRQAAADPQLPIVYFSGALGNAGPQPPGGDTPIERANQMGESLGNSVLALLASADTITDTTITRNAIRADLPPTLLEFVAPSQTDLLQFWIGNIAILSIPGEACAQLGLCLRTRAAAAGAAHVVIAGLTNDYLGYFTDTEEWFGAQYESNYNMYGAQMERWFGEQHFPSGANPLLFCSALLAPQYDAYLAGVAQGAAQQARLAEMVVTNDGILSTLATLLPTLGLLPPDIQPYIEALSAEEADRVAKQFAAFYARQQFAGLWSDAERAKFTGIADGSGIPIDALMLIQFIEEPVGIPPEFAFLLNNLGLQGEDLLPPVAFGAGPTSGIAPHTVQFRDWSTANGETIVSRQWSFGDGETSSETNPEHTYRTPGVYDVTLAVTTGGGKAFYEKTMPGLIVVEAEVSATSALGLAIGTLSILLVGTRWRVRRKPT